MINEVRKINKMNQVWRLKIDLLPNFTYKLNAKFIFSHII